MVVGGAEEGWAQVDREGKTITSSAWKQPGGITFETLKANLLL